MHRWDRILLMLIISFITLTTLTACWDRYELAQMAIITTVAIDEAEEGYEVTVQASVPVSQTGDLPTTKATSAIFSAKGATIPQAFRRMSLSLPRAPLLSHLTNLVICEEVAKQGVLNVLDSLERNEHIRPTVNLFVVKDGKAKDLISVPSLFDSSSGETISKLLDMTEYRDGTVTGVRVIDFISTVVTKEIEAVLPGVKLVGKLNDEQDSDENISKVDPDVIIKLTPYAVFKGDQLVGWLDEVDSKHVSIILGKAKDYMYTIPYKTDEYMSYHVTTSKVKIKVFVKEREPIIKITLQLSGTLQDVQSNLDLSNIEVVEKIEKIFSQQIKENLEQTIQRLQQEYQVDVLGFGGAIHRKDPKLWKEMKNEWDQDYPNVKVTVEVKTLIQQTGIIINPLEKEYQKERE